jgi:hypothetical protein
MPTAQHAGRSNRHEAVVPHYIDRMRRTQGGGTQVLILAGVR